LLNDYNSALCHYGFSAFTTIMSDGQWEANSCVASQKLPHIMWNPEVHFCLQESPLVRVLT
jgi:hypothetical protein